MEPDLRSRAALAQERPETARPPVHSSEVPPEEEGMDALDVDIDALLPVAMGAGAERVVMGPDLAELLRAAEERLDARGPISQRTDAGDDVVDVPVPDDVLRLLAEPLEVDDDELGPGTGMFGGSHAGGTGADRPATMDGHIGTAHGQEEDLEEVLPRASDPPGGVTRAPSVTGVEREVRPLSGEARSLPGDGRPLSGEVRSLPGEARSSLAGDARPPFSRDEMSAGVEPPRAAGITRPGLAPEPAPRAEPVAVRPFDEPPYRDRDDAATPAAPPSAFGRPFGDRGPGIDRGAALIERAAMAQRADLHGRRAVTERPLASDRAALGRAFPERSPQADRGHASDRGQVPDRGYAGDRGAERGDAPDRGYAGDRGAERGYVPDRGYAGDRGAERGYVPERGYAGDRGAERGHVPDRGYVPDRAALAERPSSRGGERPLHAEPPRGPGGKMAPPADVEAGGPKSRAVRTDAMPAVLGPGDAARALGRAIASRVSGALAITSGDEQRRVVLHDGDVVTAGSSVPVESLVAFLSARGDIDRDLVPRLAGKLPAFGRHAGAALVAHGHLGQDDLWPALRAHAEWIIGRALLVESGTCELEADPPARYKAEPSVFGGATGAEVFVEAVQRVIAPEAALARLGGYGARLAPGARPNLLAECALSGEEEDAVRAAPGRTIHEFAGDGPTERWSMLLALVCLDVIDSLPAAAPPKKVEEPRVDPLDEEALRARVRARLALVEEGDYFALLGVPRGATSYEVRRAYLDLRRSFEPSRILTAGTADLADDVRLVVEVIEEAYEVLRDGNRRERYRRAIEGGPPR